jgi:hypothetical protein
VPWSNIFVSAWLKWVVHFGQKFSFSMAGMCCSQKLVLAEQGMGHIQKVSANYLHFFAQIFRGRRRRRSRISVAPRAGASRRILGKNNNG